MRVLKNLQNSRQRNKVLTAKVGDKIRVITNDYGSSPAYGDIGIVTSVVIIDEYGNVDQYGSFLTQRVNLAFPKGTYYAWQLNANQFEFVDPPITQDELNKAAQLPSHDDLKGFMGL